MSTKRPMAFNNDCFASHCGLSDGMFLSSLSVCTWPRPCQNMVHPRIYYFNIFLS